MASSELDEYFAGKADTYEVFQAVAAQIEKLGPATAAVGKQISYGNKRKFPGSGSKTSPTETRAGHCACSQRPTSTYPSSRTRVA